MRRAEKKSGENDMSDDKDMCFDPRVVHVLDYGAGNVRSVLNAIASLGFTPVLIQSPDDFNFARTVVFPGVGNFGKAMAFLNSSLYKDRLIEYIRGNNKFLGICLGLQTLFEGSDECPHVPGLGIIPGYAKSFPKDQVAVPQIGWNGFAARKESPLFLHLSDKSLKECKVYFVHSYRVEMIPENMDWVLTTTTYGSENYVSSIQKGNVMATQFHPEKSGSVGLQILKGFLESEHFLEPKIPFTSLNIEPTVLAKRVIACLDVRTNDAGDLVVTKGDQYDVRESTSADVLSTEKGAVRNLGKPVDLCKRYYDEGADEIVFLNICSFRAGPIGDLPMLSVLQAASKNVFVPLTVGGGIREYTDEEGKIWSALDVASRYFRAGADKISIGTEAVFAAEQFYKNGEKCDGRSVLEKISLVYGKQAVVVSIDPKRVYISSPNDVESVSASGHTVMSVVDDAMGPRGEKYCWYQATIHGGREKRNIDAIRLAMACEKLGAGEILLNCVDMDGQKGGYDHALIEAVKKSVGIPVIASSGAGSPEHFRDVFIATKCDAALAAGIFHRKEVGIAEVKSIMKESGIPVRI